jgi:hypothetical protein
MELAVRKLLIQLTLTTISLATFGQEVSRPPAAPSSSQQPARATQAADYSGMYAFRRDGEFLQLTVEDNGSLTGFVSRYGDSESDRGVFLDQFFKQAKLDGVKISFTTVVVHGVYFDFKGAIQRGDGKNPGDEAYYVLKGTLTEYTTSAENKTASKSQEAAFKSFPHDLAPPQ